MPSIILEVCVDSIASAEAAAQGGANRLEVCASLGSGGGTTPSGGLVRALLKRFPEIPLMIMIRPRCGDFVYTENEIEVMKLDIQNFKEMGVTGVVFGVLTPGGAVDVERCKTLAHEAIPLQVTFHRAFDMTQDEIHRALLDVAKIPGITRLLTSGQKTNVTNGLPELVQIFQTCPSHIAIMPGSGVSQSSITEILDKLSPLGLKEIHMSGGEWIPGQSTWRRQGMGMGCSEEREWDVWMSSKEKIRAVKIALDLASK